MKFKDPSPEVWERYWDQLYNRLERGVGWALASIGAIILIAFGLFKLVEAVLGDARIVPFLKVGILALITGIAVLFISALRERLFVWKSDKYREVKR